MDVFVFGSNLAGIHGKGSALEAKLYWGAQEGNGEGPQGRSYAIPTKDGRGGRSLKDPGQILGLDVIRWYVEKFLTWARAHPEHTFQVVDIGCGNSGYSPTQIAPMFVGHPKNVLFLGELKP